MGLFLKISLSKIVQQKFQKWTPRTPVTLFDTQHSICEMFIFLHFVCRRSQGAQNSKRIQRYLKMISIRLCKKVFMIKAKFFFWTRCPKSALRVTLNIFKKYPQKRTSHPFYPILIPNTPFLKFFFFINFICRVVPNPWTKILISRNSFN